MLAIIAVLYATKSFLQVTLHSLEVLNHAELPTTPRRSITTGTISFRPFTEVRPISGLFSLVWSKFHLTFLLNLSTLILRRRAASVDTEGLTRHLSATPQDDRYMYRTRDTCRRSHKVRPDIHPSAHHCFLSIQFIYSSAPSPCPLLLVPAAFIEC